MAKRSFSNLQIKSITEVASEAETFIKDRRSGKEKSLKVSSAKVNSTFMNGFD